MKFLLQYVLVLISYEDQYENKTMKYNKCGIHPIMMKLRHYRVEINCLQLQIQLISCVFEHSMLCVQEIYALENAVFCIAVYGPYKP